MSGRGKAPVVSRREYKNVKVDGEERREVKSRVYRRVLSGKVVMS